MNVIGSDTVELLFNKLSVMNTLRSTIKYKNIKKLFSLNLSLFEIIIILRRVWKEAFKYARHSDFIKLQSLSLVSHLFFNYFQSVEAIANVSLQSAVIDDYVTQTKFGILVVCPKAGNPIFSRRAKSGKREHVSMWCYVTTVMDKLQAYPRQSSSTRELFQTGSNIS